IIFTASELGVFDLLRESGEPLPSATVAERLKTSLTGMQILLGACVELKVLKVEWKEGKDLYGNTEFADLFLAKSSPKSQYYTMKFFSECAYLSLQYLPEAVRTNFNSRSKEGVESFFRYMDEAWSLHGKEVVSAFDLSGFQLICDLGGSSGGLAKELISKYPNCTVKVIDLLGVVEISKKYNAFSEDSQITFHEGDFFKDPIPEADLYILSRVLFNWNDEKCIQLLTKVFTACKPGSSRSLAKELISKYPNCTVTLFDLPEVVEMSKKYNAFSDGSQITFHKGSTGGLAKELISLYPKCTVTIFDFPEVVGASKNHCLPSEDTQITFHAGDFFKDPFPEADLYILARILHDWSDERCSHKVYQACKPGGCVLIVETLLDEDRRGPLAAHIYSLLMLIMTEGKERSATEFNVLLCKAGFQEEYQVFWLKKGPFVQQEKPRTMSSLEETENIQKLFSYQHSFVTFKIISTACELGVFDLLKESREQLSSTTIAECLNTSPIGMKSLLEACVGLNLLTLEWKDGKDLYGNTDFTNLYLVKSSPKSQYHSIIFHSEVVYPSMQYLPDAVRSKEELEAFSNFMNELWPVLGREVLSAFDLSQFPLICDLGGSTGGLAKELISLYPKCTVTIFDLPEVVEASKNHCLPSEDTQITFHAGDFFKDPFPEADLYILARILHDWTDERCSQLLHKVYQACKPGGGVLIVEMLLDEDRRGPLAAHIYSLLLLLYLEGKERSTTEFNVLLRKAGFQEVELKKGNLFHIILGRK
ncbi:Hydroxyindole O-methyltransferase, partial [Ophiophagus hannah]